MNPDQPSSTSSSTLHSFCGRLYLPKVLRIVKLLEHWILCERCRHCSCSRMVMAALLQNRPSGSQKPIAKCRPHDAVLSLGTELHLLRNISGRNHSHQDLTLTGLLEPNAPATSLAAGPYLVAGKVEGHYRALDQDFPIATRCTMATTGVVCGAPKINT